MKDLISYIAQALVDRPEEVSVTEVEGNQTSVLELKVAKEDLGKIIDYDEPTFIRQKRAVGESSGAVYRGTGGSFINDSDLDVPTFLRRKAD